ncbi:Transcription initiation factor TFIID subunit 10 [Serendipita sp. 399]|nr:Transcription initiation factor TFIID subunit 10 [Serendipita sp. 399]
MSASDAAPESSKAATDAAARKDRTLAEFLLMLDDFKPLIPSEVTDYYLQRVGFDCEDERLKRLLALAAQKFVSDIAADAYSHARIRSGGARSKAGGAATKIKTVLTMDDLTAALAEYGVNAKKPEYYL